MEISESHSEFKKICEQEKRPIIDIEFTDLSYTIKDRGMNEK